MIHNALQTPELAYAAITIGFSVCLIFVIFVFFQNKRTQRIREKNQADKQTTND